MLTMVAWSTTIPREATAGLSGMVELETQIKHLEHNAQVLCDLLYTTTAVLMLRVSFVIIIIVCHEPFPTLPPSLCSLATGLRLLLKVVWCGRNLNCTASNGTVRFLAKSIEDC